MPIIQLICFQNLIDGKLHKAKSLRNVLGHIALSKRLQLLQTKDDLWTLAPTKPTSDAFLETQSRDADTGDPWEYDLSINCISEKLAALKLNDDRSN